MLLLGGDIAGKGLVPIRAQNGTLDADGPRRAGVGPGRRGGAPPRRHQPARASTPCRMDEADAARLQRGHRVRRPPVPRADRRAGRAVVRTGRRAPRRRRCAASSRPATTTPSRSTRCSRTRRASSARSASCATSDRSCWPASATSRRRRGTPTASTPRRSSTQRIAVMLDAVPHGSPVDRQLPLPALRHRPRRGAGARRDAQAGDPRAAGRASSRSAATRCATRSSTTSLWSGCTATSTSPAPSRRSGATVCLNPGSDYSADLLRGAVVDIAEDGSYLDFLFTAG